MVTLIYHTNAAIQRIAYVNEAVEQADSTLSALQKRELVDKRATALALVFDERLRGPSRAFRQRLEELITTSRKVNTRCRKMLEQGGRHARKTSMIVEMPG